MLRRVVKDVKSGAGLNNTHKRLFAADAATKDSKDSGDKDGKKTGEKLPIAKQVYTEATEWLRKFGSKYHKPADGRRWLGGDRPFPRNPWFVPPAPVSDKTRELIYEDYRSDPIQSTPRKLAEKYKLSVVRIEAILRLKHLERQQLQQGYVLQSTFRKRMERVMACDKGLTVEEAPDSRPLSKSNIASAFKLVDPDDGDYSDANSSKSSMINTRLDAESLKREHFRRRADGNYILALSNVIQEPENPPTVLEAENPREKSRFNYLFADLSHSSKSSSGSDAERVSGDQKCIVRENTGKLRTATLAEMRMHQSLFPQKRARDVSQEPIRQLWQL